MRSTGMNHQQFVDALKRNGMTLDAQHFACDDSCGYQGWTGMGSYEARLLNAIRARDSWKDMMIRTAGVQA